MEVLNSFHKVAFLAFFTTQFSYPVTGQEMFSIIRNPGDGDQWTDLDSFKLPGSKCSTKYCIDMKAHPDNSVPCQCECSYAQNATFGFYSGAWTCQANTEVRTQSGCKYKFASEANLYPLKILEQGQQYEAILPSARCSLDPNGARYFTCDGRWTGIGSQEFRIIIYGYRRRLNEVGIGFGISGDLLGRIISLNITCPQQQHSCLLFKLKGTLQCGERPTASTIASTPVSTTTPASNSTDYGQSAGSSSGTVAAVVIIIILVIIMAVIIAFVIWKRKRGENVWIMDRVESMVARRRVRPPPKAKELEEESHDIEQIYAEIHDQPTGSPTGTNTNILLTATGTVVSEEESPTDDYGYAVPIDSSYHILEDPNEQSTNAGGTGTLGTAGQQERSSVAVGTPATVPEPSDAADNKRYVTKQRRTPPNPPMRDDTQKRQHDANDGTDDTDVNEHGEGESDKNYDYESLKDRDVYQPLDMNTMDNR